MKEVMLVSFKENGNCYYFLNKGLKTKKGTNVIVKTDLGMQFGKVESDIIPIDQVNLSHKIDPIIRIATKNDVRKNKTNIRDAHSALERCRKIAKDLNLKIQVLDAYYTFDKEQLIFRFLSDTRIDFRDLAKKLASIYKTRIELRQIGVRDKSKEIGGIGPCGQQLCCARFLKDFDSISISMAKNQNLSLNPNKINGVCGRLLCCLKYENDCYKECKKGLPSIGQEVDTEYGKGKVIDLDILKRSYKVDIKDKGVFEVKNDSAK